MDNSVLVFLVCYWFRNIFFLLFRLGVWDGFQFVKRAFYQRGFCLTKSRIIRHFTLGWLSKNFHHVFLGLVLCHAAHFCCDNFRSISGTWFSGEIITTIWLPCLLGFVCEQVAINLTNIHVWTFLPNMVFSNLVFRFLLFRRQRNRFTLKITKIDMNFIVLLVDGRTHHSSSHTNCKTTHGTSGCDPSMLGLWPLIFKISYWVLIAWLHTCVVHMLRVDDYGRFLLNSWALITERVTLFMHFDNIPSVCDDDWIWKTVHSLSVINHLGVNSLLLL